MARRDVSFPDPSVMPGSEAVRMEDSSGLPPDRVRRLSLFSGVDPVRPTVPDSDGSGTEAPTSVSDGFREDPPDSPKDVMFADIPLSPSLQAGFRWLATVDVEAVFRRRAVLMKTVPVFMQDVYRSAMRVAISKIDAGRSNGDRTRSAAGWRLFMLLPRLLIFRPPRGGLVPKSQLSERFQAFSHGDCEGHVSVALKSRSRRRRRNQSAEQDLERRVARAESLVHLGELSAARLALEGDSVAPDDDVTLSVLRDPERRPPVLRDPIPEDILSTRQEVPFNLDSDRLARNIRCARRGAAGGPSGMTMDHIRPVLESEADTAGFFRMCLDFARAEILNDVLTLLKMGRVTALRKPNGKISGIVIGDIMRRLVARTIAQQVVLAVEEATAPFQYALSTKRGGECVAHAIQSLTELDPRATVLSVDGIGAFDFIARAAMLDGLLNVDGGDSVLPFVLQFYSEPSQYLWGDDTGDTHFIEQGEGGEQGDPLMPLLFSLGQHSALQFLQFFLLPGEQLFAFLDDLYVVCSPERVGATFTRLKSDLESHARIQVHLGKTKVWNGAGEEPEACSSMQEAAQRVDPDARVWTGDGPLSQQGLRVLGIPIGTPEFVRS